MWWIRHSCNASTWARACNALFPHTGSHFGWPIRTRFQQLMMSDVFKDFPETGKSSFLMVAVRLPYPWGRFRGLCARPKGFWSGWARVNNDLLWYLCFIIQRVLIFVIGYYSNEKTSCSRLKWLVPYVVLIQKRVIFWWIRKRYIDNNTVLNAEQKQAIFEGTRVVSFPRWGKH